MISSNFKLPTREETKTLVAEYISTSDKITNDFIKSEATVASLRKWFLQNNKLHPLSNKLTFGQHVSMDELVRNESRAAQETLQKYSLDVYQNEDLFMHVKKIVDPVFEGNVSVEPCELKLFKDLYRDFVHNGLLLSKDIRSKVKELKKDLQLLSMEFSKCVADDKTTVLFSKEELKGMSDTFLNGLQQQDDKFVVTMKYPDVIPIFDQCSVEATRQRLDKVYTTRCPDNIPRLKQAVIKRREMAQLLGYKSFSEYQLSDRMAKTPTAVWSFLNDLQSKLTPGGKKELAKLTELKGGKLNSYDYRYYHNQLKLKEYELDESKIQQYFPIQTVLQNVFSFYSEFFHATIEKLVKSKSEDHGCWHEDVDCYKVTDSDTNEFYGYIYTDLFPRENKYSHAACFHLQPNTHTHAIAALVCNFTKPTASQPSCLEHNEVVTLAHELGHAFHAVLSVTMYADQNGTNCSWDFVEAPSQALENFIFEKHVLKRISSHSTTHEPLTDTLIDQIIKARHLNAGLFNLRQLFFGLFDMTLHDKLTIEELKNLDINEFYGKLRTEITLLPHHEGTIGASTFNHIMGGYQSGYYGYLWSLVYASDIYSEFNDIDVGRRYRDVILRPGGSEEPMELIKRFLKREPNTDAFLKHLGLQ